jgi:N-methylhydantoinase A/oxoprolinase/acetone carboxylase beta subunit
MAVSVSSDVMSELNEYERTLSTTVDAYVNPVLTAYIDDLSGQLADLGISETLHLMQANGGVVTPETIEGRRLRLVNSGPAAGVLGAKRIGLEAGYEDLITLDMGGTSTDTCVVTDGDIEMTTEGGIENIPLLFSQIDVRSIGTGGGSIAQFDRTGVLKVGPQSAGARPGPACYGRGGDDPTVTDAAVHLGYLNPRNFLGGEIELDVAAAENALKSLAEQADIGVTELSAGVHEIVATSMVGGIRQVTVEKGYDPRQFALVCYGGAGPLFGDTLARKLGIERVLIPPASGILSAFGLVTADRRFDFSRSQPLLVTAENLPAIRRLRDDLRDKAGGVGSDLDLQWSVDVRYHGQTFDLNVQLPNGELEEADLDSLIDRFESMYESVFGIVNEDDPVEALTWRVQAVDPTQDVELRVGDTGGGVDAAHDGTRKAYDRDGFASFDVYSRYDLPHGTPVSGPAIVEEPEATTVVSGETEFVVDTTGTLVLSTE